MNDVNCPYCDADLEINHDDGYGYGEDVTYQQQCGSCGKTFVYNTCISFTYHANKADCLNGGDHDFHPTHSFPKEYTRMRCSYCDDERLMTEEERKWILTPSDNKQ